jgi:hypothetical protein
VSSAADRGRSRSGLLLVPAREGIRRKALVTGSLRTADGGGGEGVGRWGMQVPFWNLGRDLTCWGILQPFPDALTSRKKFDLS